MISALTLTLATLHHLTNRLQGVMMTYRCELQIVDNVIRHKLHVSVAVDHKHKPIKCLTHTTANSTDVKTPFRPNAKLVSADTHSTIYSKTPGQRQH